MKWKVLIPEIHYNHTEVEAESAREAIQKAMDGEGDSVMTEYSHTPTIDEVTVINPDGEDRKYPV